MALLSNWDVLLTATAEFPDVEPAFLDERRLTADRGRNPGVGADDDPFRLPVREAAIGIEQVSLEARILEANKALNAMLEYSADELHGKPLTEIIHPDDLAQCLDSHRRLIEGSLRSYSLETRYVRKGGLPIQVKLTSSLARAGDGAPAFRVSIVEDISERVAGEARRQSDEAKYRAIIDTAVDRIVVIDERGNIQAFNAAAELTFGYRSSQVIGENVRILMPEPDRRAHVGYLANYLRTCQARIIGIGREVTGRRHDGSLFPLELSIAEWRAGRQTLFHRHDARCDRA
jgi:PAS domain S-box-containing protein